MRPCSGRCIASAAGREGNGEWEGVGGGMAQRGAAAGSREPRPRAHSSRTWSIQHLRCVAAVQTLITALQQRQQPCRPSDLVCWSPPAASRHRGGQDVPCGSSAGQRKASMGVTKEAASTHGAVQRVNRALRHAKHLLSRSWPSRCFQPHATDGSKQHSKQHRNHSTASASGVLPPRHATAPA